LGLGSGLGGAIAFSTKRKEACKKKNQEAGLYWFFTELSTECGFVPIALDRVGVSL